MLTQAPNPAADAGATVMSSARPSESSVTVVAAPVPTALSPMLEPQTLVADGQLIRDARLDRYLAAHKQFAGVSVLGLPSSFVRSAAIDAPKR